MTGFVSLTRKRVLAVALLGLAGLATPAPGVVLFFDSGGPTSEVQGGPADNSNPALAIAPDRAMALYLWAIPDADDAKIVAALGFDVAATGSAVGAVTATAIALDNPPVGPNTRWMATRLVGGLNSAGKLVDDQRAVFVPTASPFVGGIGSGNLVLDPGYDDASGAVYLGRLDLQVDPAAQPGTSVELRLAVSELLIAGVTTGTPADEAVYFGFQPAGPEPATGSGSVVGATSVISDAVLTIAASGDADADMDLDLADFAAFQGCFTGSCAPSCDPAVTTSCGIVDFENDGDVDLADLSEFQTRLTGPGGEA